MSPLFFIIAAIFVISSISQRSRQKKNTDTSIPQKKTHHEFDEAIPPKTAAKVERKTVRPTVSHTVKPLTESEHTHLESSITGIEECDEYIQPSFEASDTDIEPVKTPAPPVLKFDAQNAAAGILYAEILGKPKALRR